MNYIKFFCLSFVLLGFGVVSHGICDDGTWSNKSQVVTDKIKIKLARKFQEEKGLVNIGRGGAIRDTISKIFLAFQFYRQVTSEESRALIVDVINLCLKEINTQPEWAPYFTEYPVTVNTIEIDIHVHRNDHSDFSLGTVSYMTMDQGKWYYALVVPKGDEEQYSPKETYEEALAILSAQGREPDAQCKSRD